MNDKLKEALLGVLYGLVTMLFMIGLIPQKMLSSIFGCVVAVFAIWRIRKRTGAKKDVGFFTISYMAVIIILILLLNSLSISA